MKKIIFANKHSGSFNECVFHDVIETITCKLNCVEKQIVDKKMMLKKISMGIAHIRGIDMSHKMKKIFENKKSVLMNCKFNDDNSKFEPIDINTESKFPTLLEEIESKLAIMEDSDSE